MLHCMGLTPFAAAAAAASAAAAAAAVAAAAAAAAARVTCLQAAAGVPACTTNVLMYWYTIFH